MKRFSMLPGIADMRGNVTGSQDIKYEGDKKAYEADNGKQASTNYRASYIFHKRAKDGLLYFSVKTKQTAVLNNKTRTAMAITGSIAAIKSALMKSHAADWVKIQSSYEYLKAQGLLPEGVTTFNKYVDYNLRVMLRYKRESWSFTQAGISFTVGNPYKLNNQNALRISQSVWEKFAPVLSFSNEGVIRTLFTIDGKQFISIDADSNWGGQKESMATNAPNFATSWAQITIEDEEVLYMELRVYDANGTAVNSGDNIGSGNYTTLH